MKFVNFLCFIALMWCSNAIGQTSQLETDWFVSSGPFKANITEDKARHELVLKNGVARRVIRRPPNAPTVALISIPGNK